LPLFVVDELLARPPELFLLAPPELSQPGRPIKQAATEPRINAREMLVLMVSFS
jgi:hypothetical protein